MKYIILVLIASFFAIDVAIGQFEIYGGHFFNGRNDYSEPYIIEYNSIHKLEPDVEGKGLRAKVKSSRTFESKNSRGDGFELGITNIKKLNNHIELRLGIGLSFYKFNRQEETNFVSNEIILGDTIDYIFNTINFAGSTCDETNYSPDFFEELAQADNINIMDLNLSTNLVFSVIGESIKLGIGGYLRTPVYTHVQYFESTFHTTEELGQTICNYGVNTVNDNTGNSFRNLKFGVRPSIVIDVSEKVDFHVGMNLNLMNNFISENKNEASFSSSFSYQRAKEYFLRITYKIGKSNSKSETLQTMHKERT